MKSLRCFSLFTVFLAVPALAGAQPARDFTEVSRDQSQTQYAVVVLADQAVALYNGSIPGLARTRPAQGKKLNFHAAAVAAYAGHLETTHANYRAFLTQQAPQARAVREMFYTANAVAVELNGTSLAVLGQGPGVAHVSYSALYRPTMNASAQLIGASALWPTAGGRAAAGSGVKVGVIDSGIDDSHFFFACKDRIAHKVFASGVAFFDPNRVLVSDHGTHVSGTIAGCVSQAPTVGTLSGVAPGAALFDYNVFPGFGAGFVAFGGSAFSHDIATAIEESLVDGMDVINLSLGGGVQGPHDFLAEAIDAVVVAGVVAAVAAGNSGPGTGTVGSPGSAQHALTAGASTNSHAIALFVNVASPAAGASQHVAATGDFDPYVARPANHVALADWAATGGDATACLAAPAAAPVAGKIAIIRRGVCSFTTKIRNAQNAGAFGVVVTNNVGGPPSGMAHDGTDPFPTLPAVMVSRDSGAAILAALPASATIVGPGQEVAVEADVLAGFSSRGPTPFTFLIKPDVAAPGVNIFSSVFGGEFAMFQGTSMATPHLAGSAALLVQLRPDFTPFDIKSALVNTAERVVRENGVDPGALARGNGRVNVQRAQRTPLTLDPVSVSFGLERGNRNVAQTRTVTLTNVSGSSQTCSSSISGPFVSVSPASLTLPAGATATLSVALSAGRSSTAPSGDYEGDLTLDCTGGLLRATWWLRIDREAKP